MEVLPPTNHQFMLNRFNTNAAWWSASKQLVNWHDTSADLQKTVNHSRFWNWTASSTHFLLLKCIVSPTTLLWMNKEDFGPERESKNPTIKTGGDMKVK